MANDQEQPQAEPQVSTQDYIDAIKDARDSGRSITINFSSMPAGVGVGAVRTALSGGLHNDYQDAISQAALKGKSISIDFSQIPKEPAQDNSMMGMLKNVATQAVKMALPSPAYNTPIAPTSSNPAMAGLQAAAQTLRDPSRIGPTVSQPGQLAGQAAENKVTDMGHPLLGKAAGLVTSVALDPQTYLMGGASGKAAEGAANSLIDTAKDFTPKATEVLTGTPKAATQTLLESKDLFKQATGSSDAIEGAVANVKNALDNVLKREGEQIGKVQEKLGIAKSFDQQIYEVAKGRDTGGYVTKLGQMRPEELLGEYQALKATKGMLKDPEKISQMLELQRAMGDKVRNFGEVGSTMEGLLKKASSDLGSLIERVPGGAELQSVRSKYAKARSLYDSLQPYLKDPGKAEEFLGKVFTSERPGYKTIRDNLAVLEKLSGEPVMTNLFREYAVQHLNKTVGRPAAVGAGLAALGSAATSLAHGNLPAAVATGVGGVGLIAGQSPRLVSKAIQVGRAAAPVVRSAAKNAGRAGGVTLSTLRNYLSKQQL